MKAAISVRNMYLLLGLIQSLAQRAEEAKAFMVSALLNELRETIERMFNSQP